MLELSDYVVARISMWASIIAAIAAVVSLYLMIKMMLQPRTLITFPRGTWSAHREASGRIRVQGQYHVQPLAGGYTLVDVSIGAGLFPPWKWARAQGEMNRLQTGPGGHMVTLYIDPLKGPVCCVRVRVTLADGARASMTRFLTVSNEPAA